MDRRYSLFVDLTSLAKPFYLKPRFSPKGAALELKDIKAIIDLMKKNDLSVFEMEKDGFRLKLQKGVGDQPLVSATTAQPVSAPAAAKGPVAAAPSATGTALLKDIVSPMVGTFYRAASPDAP